MPITTDYQVSNLLAFAAFRVRVDIHKHHCFQVLISLTEPFTSSIHGQLYSSRGLIINQTVAHACNAENSIALVFFIDPESRLGWHLKQLLDGQAFVDLESLWINEQWAGLSAHKLTAESLRAALPTFAQHVLQQLLQASQIPTVSCRDPRISQAITWLEAKPHLKVSLQDVAEYINLSPEHTRHLFVQEAGVAFSQFLLWKRIKHTITQVVRDQKTLTEAALNSGFADQAHFCRLFKRTFGISAKALLKNSRNIQFLSPALP